MKRSSPMLVALVAIALCGCGDKVIDSQAAELDVLDGLGGLVEAPVESVTCPTDVTANAGDTYVCTARTSRDSFRVIYEQIDDGGAMGAPRIEQIAAGD